VCRDLFSHKSRYSRINKLTFAQRRRFADARTLQGSTRDASLFAGDYNLPQSSKSCIALASPPPSLSLSLSLSLANSNESNNVALARSRASASEIICLSQQLLSIAWRSSFANHNERRQRDPPRGTFSLREAAAPHVTLSRPGRHSALSVRRIEAADRKRGGQICLEFPPISLSLSLSVSLAQRTHNRHCDCPSATP